MMNQISSYYSKKLFHKVM